MRCRVAVAVIFIALTLTIVQHAHSQDSARHTPNFPYAGGASLRDILRNTTILSILRELVNGSISYREAVENLSTVDREVADRLAAVYTATESDALNRIGDPQLNIMIERFRDGDLNIEELRSILNYADHLYRLGALDLQNYVLLLNMLSSLYRERGLSIPPDISNRIFEMLKLITGAVFSSPPDVQFIPSLYNLEIHAPSAPLSLPKPPTLPSIGIPSQLNTYLVLAIFTAIACTLLTILLRNRITGFLYMMRRTVRNRINGLLHTVYRTLHRVERDGCAEEGSLDPIAVYWIAVKRIEHLSKTRKGVSTTHREYLDVVSGLTSATVYSVFARITQLYELYRFGFKRDSSIVDEATKLCSRIVRVVQ